MKVCIEHDCGRLTHSTRCPECEAKYKQAKNTRYDAQRPGPAERGYDQRHREWRDRVLARDKVCQGWPHGSGCGAPTTVADHIIPINEGGARFDMRNGRGMCDPDHNRKRQEESMRARRRKK